MKLLDGRERKAREERKRAGLPDWLLLKKPNLEKKRNAQKFSQNLWSKM